MLGGYPAWGQFRVGDAGLSRGAFYFLFGRSLFSLSPLLFFLFGICLFCLFFSFLGVGLSCVWCGCFCVGGEGGIRVQRRLVLDAGET